MIYMGLRKALYVERNKFERKFDIFGIKSEEVLFLCQIHQGERGETEGEKVRNLLLAL